MLKYIIIFLLLVSVSSFCQTFTFEAENLEIIKGAAVFAEGNKVTFYSNGIIQIPYVNIENGFCIVKIFARETFAGSEYVKMVMQTPVSETTFIVDTKDWSYYKISVDSINQGPWQFSYVNDIENIGRRLHIDHILIEYTQYISSDTAKLMISWDANTEQDLAGYKIHCGTQSRGYKTALPVGNVTSYTVGTLAFNTKYYFAVTAYDKAGNESKYSDEVAITTKPQYKLPGDKNNDGIVDFSDKELFNKMFGTTEGNIDFDLFFDFDKNGIIDFQDQYYFNMECYGNSGNMFKLKAQVKDTMKTGETFTVDFRGILKLGEMDGFGFTFNYDSDKITIIEIISYRNFVNESLTFVNGKQGTLIGAFSQNELISTLNNTLFSIIVKIKENAATGFTSLILTNKIAKKKNRDIEFINNEDFKIYIEKVKS